MPSAQAAHTGGEAAHTGDGGGGEAAHTGGGDGGGKAASLPTPATTSQPSRQTHPHRYSLTP